MKASIFAGLLILSLAAASYGATIFLDTGERITGEITQETGDFLTLRTNNVDNQYNKKFIKRIFRDNAVITDAVATPAAVSAPPPAAPQTDTKNYPNSDSEFCLKAAIDFPGAYTEGDDISSSNFDITSGLTIAGEYVKYMNPSNIGVGYGMSYELPRKFQDFKPQISFLPVYAIIKLRSTPTPDNQFLFFTGQLGYNGFFGNNEYLTGGIAGGGLYLGAGIGAQFPLMNYTLLYTSNSGTLNVNGFTLNVNYSKVSFVIGVKID